MANFTPYITHLVSEFFGARMNPMEMNIQSILHAYRWYDS